MNPLQFLNGYKTYISIAAYAAYLVALHHNWIQPIPDLDTALKSAIGASLAHKVSKLIPQGAETTIVVAPAPAPDKPISSPPPQV